MSILRDCKEKVKKIKSFVTAKQDIEREGDFIHPSLFTRETNRLNSLLNV